MHVPALRGILRLTKLTGYGIANLHKHMIAHTASSQDFRTTDLAQHVGTLTEELCSTLGPYVQQLAIQAHVFGTAEPEGSWDAVLRESITELIERAVLLKLKMAASPYDCFAFWPEHASPVMREDMTTKGKRETGAGERQQVAYTVHAGFKGKESVGQESYEQVISEAVIVAR